MQKLDSCEQERIEHRSGESVLVHPRIGAAAERVHSRHMRARVLSTRRVHPLYLHGQIPPQRTRTPRAGARTTGWAAVALLIIALFLF